MNESDSAEPAPEHSENIHERTLNTLIQKLRDKAFLQANSISFDSAEKIIFIVETIMHHRGMWVDGRISADGYTITSCPKHGVAPIHYCVVGPRDSKTKKACGKCHYFDGQDALHGKCIAPTGKKILGEERLTYEEAFMIESKYRQRPKEIVSDLTAISASAQAEAKAKKDARKKGVPKNQKRNQTAGLPGNPKPFKGQ